MNKFIYNTETRSFSNEIRQFPSAKDPFRGINTINIDGIKFQTVQDIRNVFKDDPEEVEVFKGFRGDSVVIDEDHNSDLNDFIWTKVSKKEWKQVETSREKGSHQSNGYIDSSLGKLQYINDNGFVMVIISQSTTKKLIDLMKSSK